MSKQIAPQHCCNNAFCPCKDTSLPESQPSPSGDAAQELEDVLQRMRAALQESPSDK